MLNSLRCCFQVAISNLHVVIGLIEYFDEDNKLFDVGIDHIFQRLLDKYTIMYNIDNQTLTINIRKLGTDRFEDIGHRQTGFITQPLRCKHIRVVISKNIYEDYLNYDVYEARNRQVKF